MSLIWPMHCSGPCLKCWYPRKMVWSYHRTLPLLLPRALFVLYYLPAESFALPKDLGKAQNHHHTLLSYRHHQKLLFVHFMFFSYSFFAPKCFQAGIRLFHNDQVCSHRHTWHPLPSSHGRISECGYKLSASLPAVLHFFTRYFTYFNAFCTTTPRVFHTFHQLCQHLWALRN